MLLPPAPLKVRSTPRLLPVLALAVVSTAALPLHAELLQTWGRNTHGQLGYTTAVSTDPNPFPQSPFPTLNVTQASAGNFHALAVVGGNVYAWGDNGFGQLGFAPNSLLNTPAIVVGLPSGITDVSAGLYHSLAFKDGALYAWGRNSSGQLGNGDTTGTNSFTPVPVKNLTSGVTAFSAGGQHNLAIKDGALWAWGRNSNGQLGTGTGSLVNPTTVPGMTSGVTAIDAGTNHSLATKNGAVYAWGYNLHGQIGNGESSNATAPNVTAPYAIPQLSSGFVDVAAGAFHSLALSSDGHVYAWGETDTGQTGLPQYGTGTGFRLPTPTLIPNLSNIVDISASEYNSYALASDGSLWVWGNNQYGQLGLGDTTYYNTPTHLVPPPNYTFTSIDSGNSYALVTLVPEPTLAFLLPIPLLALKRRSR